MSIERSAGITLFLFDAHGPACPLLVAKGPASAVANREQRVLEQLSALPVAPRALGDVQGWSVQKAEPAGPCSPRFSDLATARAGRRS